MDRYCEAVTTFLRTYLPLKVIMLIRAFFGLYFDVSSNKILSFLAKVYGFGLTLTAAGGILYYDTVGLWNIPYIFEFIYIIIASIITGERHFNDFCDNIANIDKATDVQSKSILSGHFYLILFTAAVMRMILNCIFWRPTIVFICMAFITNTIDLGRIPRNIVFDSLYQRMKCLRQSFENVFASNETMLYRTAAYKVIKVKSYLKLYKRLLDCLQKIDSNIQITLSLSLAVNITKALAGTFSLMYLYEQQDKTYFILCAIEISVSMALVCLPALFSELISSEIEQIMIIITRQETIGSDKALLDVLRTGRLYIRTRPFRFSLCRVIPVDSSLPTAMFSLCMTYMFIIVQFSNNDPMK